MGQLAEPVYGVSCEEESGGEGAGMRAEQAKEIEESSKTPEVSLGWISCYLEAFEGKSHTPAERDDCWVCQMRESEAERERA